MGIETFAAENAKEAQNHVDGIAARKDIGVILISEEYYQAFYEQYFAMKINLERPILLEIPTTEEVVTSTDNIANFVKKATGVTV